jgi:hypothetical protein
MPPIEHAPGCVLDPVHWLRHAIAASGRLAAPQGSELDTVDKKSAEALADTLAHFAELDDWATVTLRDIARHATLVDEERFGAQCTCGASAQ